MEDETQHQQLTIPHTERPFSPGINPSPLRRSHPLRILNSETRTTRRWMKKKEEYTMLSAEVWLTAVACLAQGFRAQRPKQSRTTTCGVASFRPLQTDNSAK